MKFIHLTDPHFIPPGKTLYGRDPRLALDAAVADINAANSDAEMLVSPAISPIGASRKPSPIWPSAWRR